MGPCFFMIERSISFLGGAECADVSFFYVSEMAGLFYGVQKVNDLFLGGPKSPDHFPF